MLHNFISCLVACLSSLLGSFQADLQFFYLLWLVFKTTINHYNTSEVGFTKTLLRWEKKLFFKLRDEGIDLV